MHNPFKQKDVIVDEAGQILVMVPAQHRYINLNYICFPEALPKSIQKELKRII